MKKLFSPDSTEVSSSTGTSSPNDTHIRHHANVPTKDADLLNVCQLANTQWAANAALTLVWKTQAAFAADVQT